MLRINYIYFGVFFLLICFIHGFHAFIVETTTTPDRFLFLVPVIAQSLIETLLLASLVELTRQKFSAKVVAALTSVTVFLFLIHTLDLLLIRIMSVTVWGMVNILLDESLHNFVEMLYASNLPMTTWLLIFSTVIGVPAVGYFLFYHSQKLSEIKTHVIDLAKSFCHLSQPLFRDACLRLLHPSSS